MWCDGWTDARGWMMYVRGSISPRRTGYLGSEEQNMHGHRNQRVATQRQSYWRVRNIAEHGDCENRMQCTVGRDLGRSLSLRPSVPPAKIEWQRDTSTQPDADTGYYYDARPPQPPAPTRMGGQRRVGRRRVATWHTRRDAAHRHLHMLSVALDRSHFASLSCLIPGTGVAHVSLRSARTSHCSAWRRCVRPSRAFLIAHT